jgi:hypothetical protein
MHVNVVVERTPPAASKFWKHPFAPATDGHKVELYPLRLVYDKVGAEDHSALHVSMSVKCL